MTKEEMYKSLKYSLKGVLDQYGIHGKTVGVKSGTGGCAEPGGGGVTLTAEYKGAFGECSSGYVRSSTQFEGTLAQLLELDIEGDPAERAVFIAGLNAVMNKYRLADDCVSCPEDRKPKCAAHIARQYRKNNGEVNVLLAGYQPHMLEALAAEFPVRVLDLNPEIIGRTFCGVTVTHGEDDFDDAQRWAGVILCAGSALANGAIIKYVNLPKDVIFYGTTIAGCARIFGLRRLCPYSTN